MKTIEEVLEGIVFEEVQPSAFTSVVGVAIDSRQVQNQYIFIAVRGEETDGHLYINSAIEAGATLIISEEMPKKLAQKVGFIKVAGTRQIAGKIAASFYGHPSTKLKLVGITGTNGKTSVAQLCHHLFMQLGYKCGLLSTIENKINSEVLPSHLTTPDPVSLQELLHQMVADGCTHAFMEVSSHALVQSRVSACRFAGGVFTNITHDHLDYHGTFAAYIQAKKTLFDHLDEDAFALTNIDDRNGEIMVQNCAGLVKSYALKKAADYKGKILDNAASGLHMLINQVEVYTRLVGAFNASNLLAIVGIADLLGEDRYEVLRAITLMSAPAGRMDMVRSHDFTAFVDYAHTPDALENVLQTLVEIRRKGQKIITVVGCGGDRDKAKRPKMAKIATKYSDRVILTSDNPRSEDPNEIIREMEAGLERSDLMRVISITDRREAIKAAVMLGVADGIVLVAGKGHEKYQEIKGKKNPFDDKKILEELIGGTSD